MWSLIFSLPCFTFSMGNSPPKTTLASSSLLSSIGYIQWETTAEDEKREGVELSKLGQRKKVDEVINLSLKVKRQTKVWLGSDH